MSPKFCPKCGAPLRADQEFCIECGTRLDAWLEGAKEESPESRPGEVTSIMNRINLSVDQGIASPEPEHTANELFADEALGGAPGQIEPEAAADAEDLEMAASPVDETGTHEGIAYSPETIEREQDAPASLDERTGLEDVAFPYEPLAEQVVSPIAVDPHRSDRFRGENDWEENSRRHLIIIGIVALVAIGTIFTLMHSCGGANTDPQAQNVAKIVSESAQSNDSGSGSNAASESAQQEQSEQEQSEPEESAAEKTAHEKVKSAYDSLTTSAKQVKSAVETYRKTYANQRAERESTYQSMQELSHSLESARTELEDAAIPSSSKYYDASERIMTCYDNLIAALDEVIRFWEMDLNFNYPDYYPETLSIPFEEACAAEGVIGTALNKFEMTYRAIEV